MKLRIKDDSIRLRLSQSEVKILQHESYVSCICHINPGIALKYAIRKDIDNKWNITLTGNELEVRVPEDTLSVFFDDAQIGFDHRIPNGNSEGLYLLIEKDFQCLTERPHEDESDLFPNPDSTC
jgi:hypothetical protein